MSAQALSLFEQFWSHYPARNGRPKVGKQPCLLLFRDDSQHHGEHSQRQVPQPGDNSGEARAMENTHRGRLFQCQSERQPQAWVSSTGEVYRRHREIEPDVGRVAYGVPAKVDRLKGLGNAVVPQIVEALGRMILEADRFTEEAL